MMVHTAVALTKPHASTLSHWRWWACVPQPSRRRRADERHWRVTALSVSAEGSSRAISRCVSRSCSCSTQPRATAASRAPPGRRCSSGSAKHSTDAAEDDAREEGEACECAAGRSAAGGELADEDECECAAEARTEIEECEDIVPYLNSLVERRQKV